MTFDRQQLGNTLSSLRKAAGLSQRQVADETGLSRSSIANIECGRQNPTVGGLAAITAALGATTGAVFGATEPVELLARIATAQREIADGLGQLAALTQQLSEQSQRLAGDLALIPREAT